MYHPKKYNEHNSSLRRFVERFNKCSNQNKWDIKMEINERENFMDDGLIKDEKTRKELSFDWEKRHTYYETCGFPFKEFGQFERKIKKHEIKLSIQCSKKEDCFCLAWHSDFKKENILNIGSATESGKKEYSGKRFTTKFIELKYNEMNKLYKILRIAFDREWFDSRTFDIGEIK